MCVRCGIADGHIVGRWPLWQLDQHVGWPHLAGSRVEIPGLFCGDQIETWTTIQSMDRVPHPVVDQSFPGFAALSRMGVGLSQLSPQDTCTI